MIWSHWPWYEWQLILRKLQWMEDVLLGKHDDEIGCR